MYIKSMMNTGILKNTTILKMCIRDRYLAFQNFIGLVGNLLLVGAFILLITSFWGFCPVYAFFRFSTIKKEVKLNKSKNIKELIS